MTPPSHTKAPPFLYDGPEDAALRLLLAHGAGAPMDHPFMNTVASGLGQRGVRVIRFEFPYMASRRVDGKRRGPNTAKVLEAHWREVLAAHGGPGANFVGGKSMGGRYAARIAQLEAQGLASSAGAPKGLICLGYPFHPTGKPDKLRLEPLRPLSCPTLVVQGTRDPMGGRSEVEGYELDPALELVWLEDGDHGFKPRRSSGQTLEGHLEGACDAVADFMARNGSKRG